MKFPARPKVPEEFLSKKLTGEVDSFDGDVTAWQDNFNNLQAEREELLKASNSMEYVALMTRREEVATGMVHLLGDAIKLADRGVTLSEEICAELSPLSKQASEERDTALEASKQRLAELGYSPEGLREWKLSKHAARELFARFEKLDPTYVEADNLRAKIGRKSLNTSTWGTLLRSARQEFLREQREFARELTPAVA